MLSTDRADFEDHVKALCAGYNVPLGDRIEAYWKGMQKMSLAEFARCVEHALGEEGPEKIPTTGQLWKIRKALKAYPVTGKANIDTSLGTIQEQLCEYAAMKLHVDKQEFDEGMRGIKPPLKNLWEYSRPWTYVYREWRDPALVRKDTNPEGKGAECVGIIIDLDNNNRIGWTVATMLADPLYPKVLAHFKPGPRPNAAQMQQHHESIAALAEKLRI
jgi:hypothetical protein